MATNIKHMWKYIYWEIKKQYIFCTSQKYQNIFSNIKIIHKIKNNKNVEKKVKAYWKYLAFQIILNTRKQARQRYLKKNIFEDIFIKFESFLIGFFARKLGERANTIFLLRCKIFKKLNFLNY